MPQLSVAFVGADSGTWSIERLVTVSGEPLDSASRLEVLEGSRAARPVSDPGWVLRGVTSNERYVNRVEHNELLSRQEPLGRAGSTRAALIPITKSEAWWDLAQANADASSRRAHITPPSGSNTFRRLRAVCTTDATSESPSTS